MSCLVLTDRVHICVRKSPPPSLIYASIPMMVEATGGQLHCPTNAPADDSLTSSQRKKLCPKDIFRGGRGGEKIYAVNLRDTENLGPLTNN